MSTEILFFISLVEIFYKNLPNELGFIFRLRKLHNISLVQTQKFSKITYTRIL